MTRRWLVTASLGAALLPGAAVAGPGPWTMPAGKGRVIATAIYSHASKSFDDDGDARSAPDYDQYQLYLLGEYGLTDDLTVFANPNFGSIDVENEPSSTGVGFVEVGGRYRLVQRGGFVASAQASAIIPGHSRGDRVAQIGNTAMQYDLRGQMGYGWAGGFASVEGGYRWRGGIEPNEIHLDLTTGVRAAPRLQLIGNLYNTRSDGAGRNGFPSYRYHNAFAGAVYDVSESIAVQVGGLATVSGRNALRERGLFTGAWLKF